MRMMMIMCLAWMKISLTRSFLIKRQNRQGSSLLVNPSNHCFVTHFILRKNTTIIGMAITCNFFDRCAKYASNKLRGIGRTFVLAVLVEYCWFFEKKKVKIIIISDYLKILIFLLYYKNMAITKIYKNKKVQVKVL